MNTAQYLTSLWGGGTDTTINHQTPGLDHIVPHSRTLRKAREQVKLMVNDGVSPQKIRRYLHLWASWWVRTTESWQYQELLEWFLNVCWDFDPAAYAAGLLQRAINTAYQERAQALPTPGSHATA